MATTKKRSRKFRVAVEGTTSDGRVIERQHIQDMADSYDPQVYGSRVWIEHMRSTLPEGPFRAFGDVIAVSAEEADIGGAKKLALYAQIEPTDDLVNMVNVLKQKLYTSIEISPKFADTGKAYLVGLAVTDSPASLGTEMLAFAAQNPDKNPLTSRKQSPDNLFTAALETQFEFEDASVDTPRANAFTELLSRFGLAPKPVPKEKSQEPDVAEFSAQVLQLFRDIEGDVAQLRRENASSRTEVQKLSRDLATLTEQLAQTPSSFTQRPPVTGPTSGDATDC